MREIEKKISRVKSSRDYKRSEDNQAYVADLEKSLERLKSEEGFFKLDYIIEIRKKLKSILVSAKRKLIDEEDRETRIRIHADIDSYSWLLQFFSKNVEKEFKDIDSRLDELIG